MTLAALGTIAHVRTLRAVSLGSRSRLRALGPERRGGCDDRDAERSHQEEDLLAIHTTLITQTRDGPYAVPPLRESSREIPDARQESAQQRSQGNYRSVGCAGDRLGLTGPLAWS